MDGRAREVRMRARSEAMTTLTDLRSLEKRLAEATGPSREIDDLLALAVEWDWPVPKRDLNDEAAWFKLSFDEHAAKHDYHTSFIAHHPWRRDYEPEWTASLDAAVALVERVLREHGRSAAFIGSFIYEAVGNTEDATMHAQRIGLVASYANILCLTLVRALISKEEAKT